jgi:peptidoglycan/LPS O-acetylase OafA/YrhL
MVDLAKERHVLGLDLTRFAAAALVMGYHYQQGASPLHPNLLLASGWVGVEIFFVLSGYVIAYSAEGASPGAFARSRAVRLLPSVWICGTATALVAVAFSLYHDLLWRYLSSLVLWPTGPWLDTVYWTLPVEVAFYAIIWLTLVLPRRLPMQMIVSAVALVSSAYWLYRASELVTPSPNIAAVVDSLPWQVRMFAMLDFGAYFALGALYRRSQRDGLTLWRTLLMLLCLAAGAIQIAFNATSVLGVHGGELARGHHAWPILVWLIGTACIPLAVRLNEPAWATIGRYAPFVRLVGLATYPLYLLHHVAVGAFETSIGPWPCAVIAIVASLAVAAFLEPTAQRALRRLLSGGSRRAAEAHQPAG